MQTSSSSLSYADTSSATEEIFQPPYERNYKGIDLNKIFSSTQDDYLRKALILNDVRLLELDISGLSKQLLMMELNMEAKIKHLEPERNLANTRLLHATDTLYLKSMMWRFESDSCQNLGPDSFELKRIELWRKI